MESTPRLYVGTSLPNSQGNNSGYSGIDGQNHASVIIDVPSISERTILSITEDTIRIAKRGYDRNPHCMITKGSLNSVFWSGIIKKLVQRHPFSIVFESEDLAQDVWGRGDNCLILVSTESFSELRSQIESQIC